MKKISAGSPRHLEAVALAWWLILGTLLDPKKKQPPKPSNKSTFQCREAYQVIPTQGVIRPKVKLTQKTKTGASAKELTACLNLVFS